MEAPRRHEEHVGDGVYASFDGARLWLRTAREGREHELSLSGDALDGIDRFVRRLTERRSRERVQA